MKLLFLAHRTPYPPNKGDKLRSFHLLCQLAKRHEVTLVYWVDDAKDINHTAFLESLCRSKVFAVWLNPFLAMCRALFSLLRGRSFSEGYYHAKSFQIAVDEASRNGPFDAVFVFSSAVASYANGIETKTRIVDFVDVDSDKWGQLAAVSGFPWSLLYCLEQKRLSRFEVEVSSWAQLNLFVSRADAELFKKQGGNGLIEVLPNGTDLDLHRLPYDPVPFHAATSKNVAPRREARLIFVGTMNYYPNIDAVIYFARDIFPLIRRTCPRVVFEIVGRNPKRRVTQLGKLDGVRVLGEVADIRAHLLRADVSIAPMRLARGVQNKVLEAMAMGVPVVATPAAIQGIEVTDGEELLVGKNPEEFAAQVIRLLGDAALRKATIKRARHKMSQLYNWDAIGAKLEALLSLAPENLSKEVAHAPMSIGQG
jgi:sugar transferase (PEP-CTERM/EpsH1 system associated)